MEIWEAIVQGIIQGATEFLPISSSGHLSLTQHVIGAQPESLFFDIMLHVGTLVAVLAVYYKIVWRMIKEFVLLVRDVCTGHFKWKAMSDDRRLLMMLIIGLVPLFLLFLPVPGTGMKIKDYADLWATDSSVLLEGFALLATAALLTIGIICSRKYSKKVILTSDGRKMRFDGRKKYHTIDALCVGVTQCLAAVFPGLSRSGSTLSVSLMRGINKQKALDYSFVLGVPAILAAAILSIKDVSSDPVNIAPAAVIAGMIASAIVGFLAIKLFKWMLASDKLYIFAIYAFVLGLATIIVALVEQSTGTNLFTGMPL